MFKNAVKHIKNEVEKQQVQGHFLHYSLVNDMRYEVAFFYVLQMLYPHKRFNRTHIKQIENACQYRQNRVYELIRSCEECGIIVNLGDKKGTKRLLSNKELAVKFGGTEATKAYIPNHILRMGVTATMRYVRNIPTFSCIEAQPKGYQKTLNRLSKNDGSIGTFINGEMVYTIAEAAKKRKLNNLGLDKITSDPTVTVSNRKGSNINGTSTTTFIRDKYYFKSIGVLDVERRYGVLQEVASMEEWLLKKNNLLANKLPLFAKYNRKTNQIVRDLACKITFLKHA